MNIDPLDKQLEQGIIYSQRKVLLNRLKAIEKDQPPVELINRPWYKKRAFQWLLIGLILLIGIMLTIAYKQYPKPRINPVIAEYFMPIEHPLAIKRGVSKDLEERAASLYHGADYQQAVILFDSLFLYKQDTLSLLFLGISQLGVGDAKASIATLEKYRTFSPDILNEETNYFLLLSYYQEKEWKKFRNLSTHPIPQEFNSNLKMMINNVPE